MTAPSRCGILIPVFLVIAVSAFAQAKPAADSVKKAAAPKLPMAEKIKSSRKIDGLFTLYQDTASGSLQLYVKKDQIGKEFIYQSFSLSGPNSLFLNQNMIRSTLVFRIGKKFDRLEFDEMNTNLWYDSANPVSKSANADVPASTLYADKIAAEDGDGYLIAVDGLLLSERLDPIRPAPDPKAKPGEAFALGNLNAARSKYDKIRSFPENTDVVVDLAYENPAPLNQGDKGITDARYTTIKMQHTFLAMPQNDFRPRFDDPRVGYFTEEVDNLTTIKVPNYRDLIHRWNLVKKDPKAELSEPVNPIVWWVENTTPIEYRQTILDAGERWNLAFEKAGFKNAVVMKIMSDTATWDPADVRYNVIRWVASPTQTYGAIGPSFVNPRTGEILGADITVEWQSGSNAPNLDELFNGMPGEQPAPVPAALRTGMLCTLGSELKAQYTTAQTTLEATDASPEALSKMHKQFLYFLILHEMGHTMGLNHNMKASQMLSPAELNDTALTQRVGMQGSVMDYPAVNVPSDRNKQGDYYTTRPGPYDLWAIEYGYRPCAPAEEATVLGKILARSTEPALAFGNDADDMRTPGGAGIDPRVMVDDQSNDAVGYAEDRYKLVNNVMGKLKEKYSKPNQSYAELRARYLNLNRQRATMTAAVSRYIGGVYVDRSFSGQNTTNKPYTPVPVAYQKKAMAVLAKYAFAPEAYAVDAKLYPYLQLQRRGYNFFQNNEDPKPNQTVLAVQAGALAHLLSPNTLKRINASTLYGNSYSAADVLEDLNKAIFSADLSGNVNLFRQDLQAAYVRTLIHIQDAPAGMYDDPSEAAAYYSLKKLRTMLAGASSPGEQTRAHRAKLLFEIDKALVVK